jgi:hypothetical protein
MNGEFNAMSLSDMSKLPGVSDLPAAAKVPFIKALRLEEDGKHDEAQAKLEEAVAKLG